MAISATVTRTELSLANLDLSSANGYQFTLDGFSEPGITADNVIVQSRWVDGGRLVSSRWDVSRLDVKLQVRANSLADLYARIDAVKVALTQFSYTVAVTVDSVTRTYTCMPANVDVEPYSSPLLTQKYAYVSASIPCQPQIS